VRPLDERRDERAEKAVMPAEAIEHARELLAAARRVVVLTGAGVSAESGVPTFRGEDGLWRAYRAEDLATPQAFGRDPRLVWEWYAWRRELVARCEPNAAHLALARLAMSRGGVLIITQNVDGLHVEAAHRVSGAAGASDARRAMPLELHGSLFVTRCTACTWRREDRGAVDATSVETLPRCPSCGALARPGVVWFGEALDAATLERAFAEAMAADLCLVIGTSAVVHPAAGVALATHRAGGHIIEVNPVDTPLTRFAAVTIRDAAARAVPAIVGDSLSRLRG
jgi:NAD-dependent deacetylase